MNKAVLDSSVIIALLKRENNTDITLIEEVLPHSITSTVHVLEVAQFLCKQGMPMSKISVLLQAILPDIIPLSLDTSLIAAQLISMTQQHGLSLADRVCLALGITTGYTVYTTDRVWANLRIKGLKVKIVRLK